METKAFEVRDRGTCIPIIATNLSINTIDTAESRLIGAGFGLVTNTVLVTRLSNMQTEHDRFAWQGTGRTMHIAHRHIEDNFDELTTGDVVDVEFIMGETSVPKKGLY